MIQKFKIFFFCMLCFTLHSQENQTIKWINPADNDRISFQGQGWTRSELASPYDRLPSKAENYVRDAVWNLSRDNAGISLSFSTDAPEIKVRYQVSGAIAMGHMPATGVSGLDLYVRSKENKEWLWCKGWNWASFESDTLLYTFSSLNTRHPQPGTTYDYQLYLPLYNAVQWMEIGIPGSARFTSDDIKKNKPIVVYGTSIAQGACASRPGMAWTSIVQRKRNQPVVNLAFSGNGRLEPELISLINEIDAALFVLDCLPNLTNKSTYPQDEIEKRIEESVLALKKEHPHTPVLLTEHAGYSNDQVSEESFESVSRVNKIQHQVFEKLKKEGIKDLYYLIKQDINMCMDCTVDGTHQTDQGMEYYARAYLGKIRKILK